MSLRLAGQLIHHTWPLGPKLLRCAKSAERYVPLDTLPVALLLRYTHIKTSIFILAAAPLLSYRTFSQLCTCLTLSAGARIGKTPLYISILFIKIKVIALVRNYLIPNFMNNPRSYSDYIIGLYTFSGIQIWCYTNSKQFITSLDEIYIKYVVNATNCVSQTLIEMWFT